MGDGDGIRTRVSGFAVQRIATLPPHLQLFIYEYYNGKQGGKNCYSSSYLGVPICYPSLFQMVKVGTFHVWDVSHIIFVHVYNTLVWYIPV